MYRVRLIHWNETEARQRAETLRALGYDVDHAPMTSTALAAMRGHPPDAAVIDLSRIPSQGRDVGLGLRLFKATRRMPLVFVGGDPNKTAGVRALLPDAAFTPWPEIGEVLSDAIAHPLENPVVPSSGLSGYSGAPLAKKLGIKAGSRVALVDAPPDFEQIFNAPSAGGAPKGVTFVRAIEDPTDLTLWFVRTGEELEQGMAAMTAAGAGGLWIVWPKKTSALASDLTQATVRATGLAAGLVDFKVCAVDDTWSGLKFTVRKSR